MVTPTALREVGCWLMSEKGVSQRRACNLVGLHRSVARYRHRQRDDGPIRDRLKELAGRHRRYGYLRLHVLLRREGLVINHKRTYRLYRDEGLAVRTKKRKRLAGRERVPLAAPERRNQRWSMDFVSDSLCSGRRFRVLNIVDEHTRESPGQLVDLSISGERVTRLTAFLIAMLPHLNSARLASFLTLCGATLLASLRRGVQAPAEHSGRIL